jgi:hypothetical protein
VVEYLDDFNVSRRAGKIEKVLSGGRIDVPHEMGWVFGDKSFYIFNVLVENM